MRKVKCGRQGYLCKNQPLMENPESHLEGARASSDPNKTNIAQALGLSTTTRRGVGGVLIWPAQEDRQQSSLLCRGLTGDTSSVGSILARDGRVATSAVKKLLTCESVLSSMVNRELTQA
jgi:hypothetical protein